VDRYDQEQRSAIGPVPKFAVEFPVSHAVNSVIFRDMLQPAPSETRVVVLGQRTSASWPHGAPGDPLRPREGRLILHRRAVGVGLERRVHHVERGRRHAQFAPERRYCYAVTK